MREIKFRWWNGQQMVTHRNKWTKWERPGIARNTDPETSHIAAENHTRGKRGERAMQTLKLVGDHPNRTSGEYSRLFYSIYTDLPIRTAVETPHKRLPDLEKKGLVQRSTFPRKCSDSGQDCLTWDITEAGLRELKAHS